MEPGWLKRPRKKIDDRTRNADRQDALELFEKRRNAGHVDDRLLVGDGPRAIQKLLFVCSTL